LGAYSLGLLVITNISCFITHILAHLFSHNHLPSSPSGLVAVQQKFQEVGALPKVTEDDYEKINALRYELFHIKHEMQNLKEWKLFARCERWQQRRVFEVSCC
jgi:hypothetical protein